MPVKYCKREGYSFHTLKNDAAKPEEDWNAPSVIISTIGSHNHFLMKGEIKKTSPDQHYSFSHLIQIGIIRKILSIGFVLLVTIKPHYFCHEAIRQTENSNTTESDDAQAQSLEEQTENTSLYQFSTLPQLSMAIYPAILDMTQYHHGPTEYWHLYMLECKLRGYVLQFYFLVVQSIVKLTIAQHEARHRRVLPDFYYTDFIEPVQPVIHVYPTLQRSYNAAPTVDMEKLRRLDSLSNSQYMIAIFNDLTQEERENLMFQEKQRIRTYLHHWQHEAYMSGKSMAAAGFYYLNVGDRVQCAFCRGILHQWERGDNPMAEHKSNFPFCRFTKRQECGNQPYHDTAIILTGDQLRNIRITDRSLSDLTGDGRNETFGRNIVAENLGITTVKPAKPEYAPEATRLRTYGQYPTDANVPKDKLCEAGFYYVGFNDTVKCFFCEGQLKDWAVGDDPWKEHAKWFPDCYFLLSKKGERFVKIARGIPIESDDAVVSFKKKQKPMSWIARYCLDLGHNAANIEKVIANTKTPFSDPSSMLAALYDLEDNPNMYDIQEHSMDTSSGLVKDSPENQLVSVADMDPDTRIDHMRRMVHGDSPTDMTTFGMCCGRQCQPKQKADHVGLPCGCLLYCSTCQQNSPERCPKCSQILRGVMKVYTS